MRLLYGHATPDLLMGVEGLAAYLANDCHTTLCIAL